MAGSKFDNLLKTRRQEEAIDYTRVAGYVPTAKAEKFFEILDANNVKADAAMEAFVDDVISTHYDDADKILKNREAEAKKKEEAEKAAAAGGGNGRKRTAR